jgi:hypothetical protein
VVDLVEGCDHAGITRVGREGAPPVRKRPGCATSCSTSSTRVPALTRSGRT